MMMYPWGCWIVEGFTNASGTGKGRWRILPVRESWGDSNDLEASFYNLCFMFAYSVAQFTHTTRCTTARQCPHFNRDLINA